MYTRSADIELINQTLAQWFPSMIERIMLTDSREGRTISALRIHAGAETNRRGVLFVGGTHARELLNPDALVDLTIGLLLHYFNGTDWVIGGRTWDAGILRSAMHILDIFILPNANPDGREYVFDIEPMWRKNRAPLTGTTCVGVDLNRNFDLLWGIETRSPEGGITTSRSPCSDVYFGPGAFSEPETRNVKTLLDDHRIDCMVDVHSFSELVLYPWGHAPNQTTDPSKRFTLVDTSTWQELPRDAPDYKEYIPPADLERFEKVGASAAQAIKDVRGRTYTVQPGTALYATTGTTSDYAYARHVANPALRKVYGFTFETGPWTGDVEESFQPPFPEANRIMEEAISGLLSVLHSCVCAIDLIGGQLLGTDDGSLTAMRSVRDDQLADTDAGRAWIALLERHDAELVAVASRDDAFKHVVGELITIAGRILTAEQFDPDHAREVRAVLGQLERAELSTELRADLRRLHLLTRQFEGRPIDEAIGHLRRVPPTSPR
ncbi:MAG: M14 family zinc carboxypeptidase [Pseudonocardiales bacterium]